MVSLSSDFVFIILWLFITKYENYIDNCAYEIYAELIIMDEPTAGLDPVFRSELLNILCSILVGLLGKTFGLPHIERFILFSDIASVLTLGMLFASVFYQLYFKFGLNKMRAVNIVLFMILMFLPAFVMDYAKSHPDNSIIKAFISTISNTPMWVLQALMLIISLTLFLFSALVSMRIYKNKDF